MAKISKTQIEKKNEIYRRAVCTSSGDNVRSEMIMHCESVSCLTPLSHSSSLWQPDGFTTRQCTTSSARVIQLVQGLLRCSYLSRKAKVIAWKVGTRKALHAHLSCALQIFILTKKKQMTKIPIFSHIFRVVA